MWLREQQTVPPPPPPGRGRPRWLLPLVAAAAALAVALAAAGLALAARDRRDGGAAAAPTAGSAPDPPATTAPARPSAVAAQLRQIEQQLEQVRDLRFLRPVPSEVLSNRELARKLLAEIDRETDEADLARQARALVLLGELPAGTELVKLLREVQAESVLGFYVPGTGPGKGRLYVRSQGGLTPFAEFVLSHELTHAVTDQHFDLTRSDRLEDQGLDDELLAYTALAEGDATLTMQRYLQSQMPPATQVEVAREGLAQTTPKLDRAPAVIRESLAFPYQAGLAFVQALDRSGGSAAIDRAYRDPPTSTEQILHPERYLRRDDPQQVRVPDLAGALGAGWSGGADVGFGEFDVSLLLGGELAVSTARSAAAGWDGGRLRTFSRGGATAMVVRTVWDSSAQADEYCKATARWANERFGTGTAGAAPGSGRWAGRGQRAALVCRGTRAAWFSAPDAGALERLVAGLGAP
ncbi:MAG TPA: hypothetical protein VKG45_10425 [Actinomycetes bacterium]|nr:hypothetical protein [Actinomycetes bacterium]